VPTTAASYHPRPSSGVSLSPRGSASRRPRLPWRRHLPWTLVLRGPRGISPAGVVGLEGPGSSPKIIQVDVPAERVCVFRVGVPGFCRIVSVEVSPEFASLSFEPLFLVQEESTVTVTVELDTFVVVVQLKVSSPASDDQVRRCSVTQFFPGRIIHFRSLLPLAPGVVAVLRVNRGRFPIAML